jgi:hypothetical protein
MSIAPDLRSEEYRALVFYRLRRPKAGEANTRSGLMGKGREIRCYDYVNQPYERVRGALSKDTLSVFQHATKAAASRAHSVASELRVNVGGIEVGTDIAITVNKIEERGREGGLDPTAHLHIEWEAANRRAFSPSCKPSLRSTP